MPTEADRALDDAIRGVAVAEEWTGVITGWVVFVGFVDTTGEGEDQSGIATIYPEGHQAWHTSLGIVEGGRLRMRQQFLTEYRDD